MNILPVGSKPFDLVSLGEVMLRLDPGDERIRTTRSFRAWEGGGEYNVARGLHKCFGMRTAIVTALAENEVGRLVADLISQGGVDCRFLKWLEFDGVGRNVRNGLNFTERGFGVRGAVGVSDRGNTAIAQCGPEDFDFDAIFASIGSRWLHTGGIFAALSEKSAQVAQRAMTVARANQTIVSYDLNYRPSLWKSIGGKAKAQQVNQSLIDNVDVIFGNEEDFEVALGLELDSVDSNYSNLNEDSYKRMIDKAVKAHPNLQVVAVTLRTVHSASRNDWTGIAFSQKEGFVVGKRYAELEIFDRVGGGDSFASGFIFGLLTGAPLQQCLEWGLAHGALAMTTPGDTSMATLSEVKKLAEGGSARVQR